MTCRTIAMFAWLVGSAALSYGQPTAIPQIRFNSGQNVVPYFEGWIKNPDATFDLVFGYFNRNYQEELIIPPGPDNKLEPGSIDQGQPTYFLPRRQRWGFRVRVPADFGKKSLIWTITAHGRTEKAYGELLPVMEITERIIMTNGGLDPGDDDPNKPPTVSVEAVANATAGAPVTLTASVSDDGLPQPRVPPAPRPTSAPVPTTPSTTPPGFGAQVNSSGSSPRPRGLSVTWIEMRGPAKVTFEPASGRVADGKATTRARFEAPGIYTLVAIANDGALARRVPLTVVVKDGVSPRVQP